MNENLVNKQQQLEDTIRKFQSDQDQYKIKEKTIETKYKELTSTQQQILDSLDNINELVITFSDPSIVKDIKDEINKNVYTQISEYMEIIKKTRLDLEKKLESKFTDENTSLVATFENKTNMIQQRLSELDLLSSEISNKRLKLQVIDDYLEQRSDIIQTQEAFLTEKRKFLTDKIGNIDELVNSIETFKTLSKSTSPQELSNDINNIVKRQEVAQKQIASASKTLEKIEKMSDKISNNKIIKKINQLEQNIQGVILIAALPFVFTTFRWLTGF
jgi:hypothetical protein